MRTWNSLPPRLRRLLPALAAFLLGLLLGIVLGRPHDVLRLLRGVERHLAAAPGDVDSGAMLLNFSGPLLRDVARNRVVVVAPAPDADASEHFLMAGGSGQYLDLCPQTGCVAVEFTRQGTVVHAYPLRPELADKSRREVTPYGLLKLPGGDLIVVFRAPRGGVARIRPDGSVAWFRDAFANHWPRLVGPDEIAMPEMERLPSEIRFSVAGEQRSLGCADGVADEFVTVIGPDGRVRLRISVLKSLLASPYRGLLYQVPNPCLPVHLNYIARVSLGIVKLYPDVAPDDLLISLRDLDAFAILGRDGRIKHLFRGTFLRQHSVQPLGDSATVLIVDDHGGGPEGGPSRLLSYDLATGARRTLLPNANAPGINFQTSVSGNISVSPDGQRLILASTLEGRGYELRIADGRVLTVFNNVHDVSSDASLPSERLSRAGRFRQFGIYYVR